METFLKDWNEKLLKIELISENSVEIFSGLENNLEKYIERAKDTLKKKHIINPKPQKRIQRIIEDESEEEPEESVRIVSEFKAPAPPASKPPENAVARTSSDSAALRPVRSAKIHASKNLKELPQNLKMRNENNTTVIVKTERVSDQINVTSSRDSLKENAVPPVAVMDKSKENIRRSQSVEIIPVKPVEIDMTLDNSDRIMPPPPLPPKQKKGKTAKKHDEVDPTQPLPLRVTRSKIKKEKVSVSKTQSETIVKEVNASVRKSQSESVLQQSVASSDNSVLQKTVETSMEPGTKAKRKYPMPILIKIERTSDDKRASKEIPVNNGATASAKPSIENDAISPLNQINNETFNLPIGDQTVTISPAVINNETITLESAADGNVNETVTLGKNPHDSLMTEDNDEEENNSMDVPLSQLTADMPPPQQTMKLKHNEIFSPFAASPVKKKVEAFEKHAMEAKTPEKGRAGTSASSSKYNVLKSGTPSKIALYSAKGATPMSNAKQKYIAAVSSASSSGVKKSVQKKFSSMSNENQEELKKVQTAAQIEEKKRQREEKQKQVQLQRENLEKQKREQTIQQQKERDLKYKRMMEEKEKQKLAEAQRKKILKEQQERKFAEERARKEEIAAAMQAQPPSASKDDSLYYKMQKQVLAEKQQAMKKAEAQKKAQEKNAYNFDMLNTDDSTDDERTIAKKRPPPPEWCNKQNRKRSMVQQSYVNPELLDTLFSAQPIHVDLRAIFPSIESRKLARNSSAVWNTPPRYSVYAKTLQKPY